MASLIDELISILNEELEVYNDFIPVCSKKTEIIIQNKVDEIQEISMQEQEYLDRIALLEKKRVTVMKNMADVTGKDYEQLSIASVIRMIDKQPNEQKKLSEIHDNLKSTTRKLVDINNHNKSLIQQSLEMIEFNMNFIQSTWMSPGNNNYDRGAGMIYEQLANNTMFDAKQ